ncbi:MAG TPA: TIGR01841 family phasin [Burkholderiaceae bacterium]|nr:TIGR01841 family phasin [Burkholderiaceae bacterium]HQR70897.1 TIGR01841 family phasin [Burkholderiaceae bacterium]
MATKARKSTAKKRTHKASPVRRAARGAAKAAPARAAAPENLFGMSMTGLGKTLDRLNLSGVASTIAEGRRKDLAALIAANKKSYEGLQSVVARQTAMLKNAVSEWQSIAQGVSHGGGRQGMGQMDEVAKQAFTMALNNIRELGELAARSQAEAFEIVRRRIMENVEEVNALIRRR